MSKIAIDCKAVRALLEDTSKSAHSRAAALGWLMLSDCLNRSPISPGDRSVFSSQICDVIQSSENWEFGSVVIFWLETHGEENVYEAPKIIGHLLDAFRNNSGALLELHQFLSDWRERSSEPVHKNGVINAWLEYSWMDD